MRPVWSGSWDRFSGHDAGGLDVDHAVLGALDRFAAVDRDADGVDHPAEQLIADRDLDDLSSPLDLIPLADSLVVTEQNDTDVVLLEV